MVALPDFPGGKELEELVAAVYQVGGYYVEKSVVESEPGQQILELDAVATNYSSSGPTQTLIEVKSGGHWGFPDLFKLRGQMTYLGIDEGAFYTSTLPPDKGINVIEDRCGRMNVRFVALAKDQLEGESPEVRIGGMHISDAAGLAVWRFSYWVERMLYEHLARDRRSNPGRKSLQDAVDYFHTINNQTFFESDVRDRARSLYSSFQAHPRLTAAMCREFQGEEYDPQSSAQGGAVLTEAMYAGKHLSIQASMYLEHRARLGILKAVVDYALLRATGKIEPREHIFLKNFPVTSWFDFLPGSFRAAVEELGTHEHFPRYPYFWQVFLWGWGGFYLRHRKEEEFDELSRQTGIPVEAIPDALRTFDVLFPISGSSWFSEPATSDISLLKMMPVAFRGIGAFHRKVRCQIESYADLGGNGYTASDLGAWHNVGHVLLSEGKAPS